MKNKIKQKQIKKNKQTKTSTNTTIFFSLKPGVRPCLYNVERGPTQPSVSPVHSNAGHFQKYTPTALSKSRVQPGTKSGINYVVHKLSFWFDILTIFYNTA